MEKELDLIQVWNVIKKRWFMIVIIPLLAAATSAVISLYVLTPQYEASATMIVVRPAEQSQLVFQDIQVNRQLVATYREIILSRRVLEVVIATKSLSHSVQELRDKIEVEAVRDTELITVKVMDADPVLARDIANETSRAFMDQIILIMNVENVSIVDSAVTPPDPVSPRVLLNIVVAFAVGLLAAVGLSFLYEYLDQTIKDPDEAKKLLDIPAVGIIPHSDEDQLFASNSPRSPEAEAFRTLRTNIQYTGIDQRLKVILVTGANPACGKSTVSSNLAVTLSQTGSSVLLIDCDMRKPTLHRVFDTQSEPGLSTVVAGQNVEAESVIKQTKHKNLKLLTCGPIPPYPAELLGSDKMRRLVKQFAGEFDYIVMDSPPVIAVTDAALLSRLADGTILVLDHGGVKRDEATVAVESLLKVQANLIGFVLNDIPVGRGYYYYEHSKYYGQDKPAKRKGKPKYRSS